MRFYNAPDRILRRREQFDTRLSMVCDFERNTATAPPAPGYEPGYEFQPLFQKVPCYVWNLLYLLQGEFVFPEREYVSGQLRALLPVMGPNGENYSQILKERDELTNVQLPQLDRHGNITGYEMLYPGPLNIYLVVPHSVYTLLVLRGAH